MHEKCLYDSNRYSENSTVPLVRSRIMKLAVLTTAAFLASSTFLSAATFTEKVIDKLEEQGFQITEVDHGNGLIKVESVRNGKTRELVYDAQTGELLKDEYDGEDQIDDNEDYDHDGVGTDDDSSDDESSDDDSSD